MGQRIAFSIGIGTADGNLLYPVDVQWQQVVGILQQNDGFAGCLQGNRFVLRFLHLTVGTGKVGLIRGVEQSDKELHPEYVTHAVVDDLFAQSAFLHQLAEGKDEGVGRAEGATDVQSGFHALADGFLHVFCRAVLGVEVFHGVTVGHHVAPESHFAAQAGSQPVVASLDGDAVVVVVRTHHAQQSGFFDNPAEGVDVYVLHFPR